MSEPITPDHLRALAALADLPLDEERLEPIAELLSAWVPAANELSRAVSEAVHDQVLPITVVTQPGAVDARE